MLFGIFEYPRIVGGITKAFGFGVQKMVLDREGILIFCSRKFRKGVSEFFVDFFLTCRKT